MSRVTGVSFAEHCRRTFFEPLGMSVSHFREDVTRIVPGLAQNYTHPRVFATANGGLEPRMKVAFYVCLLGMVLLYTTMWKYERTSKNTSAQIKALRRRLAGEDTRAPRRSAAPTLESA